MQDFVENFGQKLRAWCQRTPNAANSAGNRKLSRLQSAKQVGSKNICDDRLLNAAPLGPPSATSPDNFAIQDNESDQGRPQTTSWSVRSPEADFPERIDPDRSPQHDSEGAHSKLRSAHEDSPLAENTDAPLDTSESHLHVEVETTAEDDRNQAVWDAWDRVQAAQEAFDNRDDARERAEHARCEALERGDEVEDANSEAFDLRWHMHERRLTRGLIEAEEAYLEAQAAAKEAGEDDMRPYEVSESADSGGEDYSSSLDHFDSIATVPTASIERWLSDLPSPSEAAYPDLPECPVEIDDWEAAELDVGDRVSAIIGAEIAAIRNPVREKIEQWREVQKGLRRKFETSRPAYLHEHAWVEV